VAEFHPLSRNHGRCPDGEPRTGLRVVGKNAGQLMGDIDFLYEGVLALNARAAAILDNWEEGKLVLPTKAFVFSMRHGEQFMFSIADGRSDDPPVYHYFEGWGQFKKAANSLWEVVEAELEMQERLRQEYPDSPVRS
jgi:hypothetical protein